MNDRIKIGADPDFVKHLKKYGDESLKKCYQCATCSVVCGLSPEEYAFPRKEMIQATWGMKEKLLSDPDVWLCHGCMDCSEQCPRNARPADLMGAVRSYVYRAFAVPKFLGKALAEPKYLPVMILVAMAAIFLLVMATNIIVHDGDMNLLAIRDGVITEQVAEQEGIPLTEAYFQSKQAAGAPTFEHFEKLGGTVSFEEYKALGGKYDRAAFIDNYGVLKYEDFIHKLVIEAFFIPGNLLIFFLAALGLINYWKAMESSTPYKQKKKFIPSVIAVLGDFLAHKKFDDCDGNSNRYYGHLYAFYGFLGTAIATGIVVVGELYHYNILKLLHLPYPMGLFHWVKIIGMVSGIFLFIGLLMFMIKRIRTEKEKGRSSYNDWLFLTVILLVAATGILSVFARLSGLPGFAYPVYFVHLSCVFFLLWYMPWSKFAHMIYRFLGLTFLKTRGRENKPEYFQRNQIKVKQADLSKV